MTEISEEDFKIFQKQKEEIKDKLKSDHEEIIVSNARAMHGLQKTIRDQQQIIENMDSKISRQSHVLASLNQERDETAKELKAKDQRILKLQEENHSLKFGDSTQDEIKTIVTELLEESKKQDEMKMMLTELLEESRQNKRQRTQEA